jgi:1,4-dihydroxy-2-naphthoate octaprenyltransferase
LVLFVLLTWAPFTVVSPLWFIAPATFVVNVLVLPVLFINIIAISAKKPKDQILALQLTSFTALLFAIGLCWGLFTLSF